MVSPKARAQRIGTVQIMRLIIDAPLLPKKHRIDLCIEFTFSIEIFHDIHHLTEGSLEHGEVSPRLIRESGDSARGPLFAYCISLGQLTCQLKEQLLVALARVGRKIPVALLEAFVVGHDIFIVHGDSSLYIAPLCVFPGLGRAMATLERGQSEPTPDNFVLW